MKNEIRYYEKSFDVVVVGGGLAGVCAAIASARNGARTVLVQNRAVLGGNSSSEIRMHIVGASCHMAKPNNAETGILMELLLENKNLNTVQSFSIWDTILLEKTRQTENLEVLLNTNMNQIECSNGEIMSIQCHQTTTETSFKISGKIFIDATGHGTLGMLAGAEMRIGSESRYEFNEPNAPEKPNKFTMGNTLMFQAVDRGEPVKFKKPFWAYSFTEDDLKHRYHYNGTFALGDGGVPTEFVAGEMKNLPEFYSMDAGYWWIELGGKYDDIIAESESIRDELLKCVYGVWDHIKNCGNHGAENYDLVWVGMVPGYRESRRLVGDYILNENDVRSGRIFEDAVAYGGWPMDEHVPGGIMDFDKYPSRIFNFDGVYTIPYRCYYSKNIKNLMMAGRNISASKMAFGSTRVMGTCAVGGQAVGTAAAMAVRYTCTPRELAAHMNELQQTLLKHDCYIPGYRNEDPSDLARSASVSATSFVSGCEPENVVNGIARTVGDKQNCWESKPLGENSETLSLDLYCPHEIHELRLTFDPNLTREIMPSITNQVRNRQVKELPEELVKDYIVTFYNGRKVTFSRLIKENIQRLNIIKLKEAVIADRVDIAILSTHGYPSARIYEVRLY
jgi:hypothetical protein